MKFCGGKNIMESILTGMAEMMCPEAVVPQCISESSGMSNTITII